MEPGIDPGTTGVEVIDEREVPGDGRTGTVRVTPRDPRGNPLGPGRGDRFELTGQPGTSPTGPIVDNGDGSYDVPVEWDPSVSPEPGVIVTQPDRDPVPLAPKPERKPKRACPLWLCVLLAATLAISLLVILIVLLR